MSTSTNSLGAFLSARRGLVTPLQAGIPDDGRRRVRGLRREEVAMLAGISDDYYLRLERGRNRNPSVQVLRSIARVLQLDDDHLAHLLSLVDAAPSRPQRSQRRAQVPPGAMKLIGALPQPAFIEDRYFEVIAANHLATALSPGLRVGANQLRALFLDPVVQAFHPDWEDVTECFVANLRQAVGNDVDDPRYIELTGALALASPRFRRLWARHEVRGQRGTSIRIEHPLVGQMTFNRERLAIAGSDDLMLVVYHPDAGSSHAEKLTLLASAALPNAADRPLETHR